MEDFTTSTWKSRLYKSLHITEGSEKENMKPILKTWIVEQHMHTHTQIYTHSQKQLLV